jgi:hypothetical protein
MLLVNESDIRILLEICNRTIVRNSGAKYNQIQAWEELLVALDERYLQHPSVTLCVSRLAAKRMARKQARDRVVEGLKSWGKDNTYAARAARLTALNLSLLTNEFGHVDEVIRQLNSDLGSITSKNSWAIARATCSYIHSYDAKTIMEACYAEIRGGMRRRFVSELLGDEPLLRDLSNRVNLLSLGNGCYGWMQLSRMGFRNNIFESRHWSPFNMSQWTLAGAILGIREQFVSLQDVNKYKVMKGADGAPVAYNTAYQALFNHEGGGEFIANDFEGLRKRYASYCEQFKKSWSGRRCYVFVNWRVEPVAELQRLIEEKTQDDQYRLIVLDTAIKPADPGPLHPLTRYYHVPRPNPNYFWVNDGSSPEGITFDLQIRSIVKQVMVEALPPFNFS